MLTWGILFKLKLNFSDLPKVHQIIIKPHCLNIASLKTISDLTKNDVTLSLKNVSFCYDKASDSKGVTDISFSLFKAVNAIKQGA